MNCNELIKELTKLRKQGYEEYPIENGWGDLNGR